MSLARARREPEVQDLSGAFEEAALEDGEGAAVDGGVALDAVGRHGVGDEHSEELLCKLALNAWLAAQEPQRSVARPPSFYDTIVDVLWDMGVRECQDIATLTAEDGQFHTPMQRGFFRTIAHPAAMKAFAPAAVAVVGGSAPATATENLLRQQFLMFQQIGEHAGKKEKKTTAPVDMEAELAKLGLCGMPQLCKPPPDELDKLKVKGEELAKSRSCNFVNVKLHKFLPPHARDAQDKAESDEEDESETMRTMQKVMGITKNKRSLSMLQCIDALHRYVLAGAMTQQFQYASGMAHIANVMKVAAKAAKAGKRHQLAVMYDEKVREKWEFEAHAAGKSDEFKIDVAMCQFDKSTFDDVLEEGSKVRGAPVQQNFAQRPFESKGKGKGKSKAFDGVCNFCGVKGHKKSDCYKWLAEQRNGGEARLQSGGEPEAKRKKF